MIRELANEEIRRLIPHAQRMCLLDRVVSWNGASICCITHSHRDPLNPLRCGDRLAALHLCEYGAQAMAAHGGLLAQLDHGGKAPAGMLAALRDVQLTVDRIDDLEGPLTVVAHRRVAGPSGCLYDFEVSAGSQWLARGRVSVIFAAPDAPLRV